MALTLRDVVYQVRVKLGELIPNFWNDEDIVYDVNYAIQDMCSAAGNLESAWQFPWPNVPGTTIPIQEAALSPHVDQIFGVGYFSGQFFQLGQIDAGDVQVANRVSGIPIGFYTRTFTRLMTPQGNNITNTGDISLVPLNPCNPDGADYTTVLGLWPIPNQNLNVTIWGTQFHPFLTLQNELGQIAIPARFSRGIVGYAVARGKEKESALDEAKYYDAQYELFKQQFMDHCVARNQLRTFPAYGGSEWPTLARGSSSVIFIDQNPLNLSG